MSDRPIPPELAKYPEDLLRAEIDRRYDVNSLRLSFEAYIQKLGELANAAGLRIAFTAVAIEVLEERAREISEGLHANGHLVDRKNGINEPTAIPRLELPGPGVSELMTDVEEIRKATQDRTAYIYHPDIREWYGLQKTLTRRTIKAHMAKGRTFHRRIGSVTKTS
jgi:hypothetical protein